jgi:hypothetical protein
MHGVSLVSASLGVLAGSGTPGDTLKPKGNKCNHAGIISAPAWADRLQSVRVYDDKFLLIMHSPPNTR